MPKERRDRSVSIERSQHSPYQRTTSHPKTSLPKTAENLLQWENTRCPICIEHPHNAILLLCSSHDKGCRPFMCDTSYRHSNCFDQFQKSFSQIKSSENNNKNSNLVCPLCRGRVNGWVVVDPARSYMNKQTRNCANENCEFLGTYKELRMHARLDHPHARPLEVDVQRQQDWRRLERERDLGDLLSMFRSSINEENENNNNNNNHLGDLLSSLHSSINEENNTNNNDDENDGDENNNGNNNSSMSFDERGWLTVYFMIRVSRPADSLRSRAQVTIRRRLRTRLWGENYENNVENDNDNDDNDDNDHESLDNGSGPRNLFWLSRRRPTPDNNNNEES